MSKTKGERFTSDTSTIVLRVAQNRKAAYVRSSNRKKQTLAAWIFDACDAAANKNS
jgi:hypothetical protein